MGSAGRLLHIRDMLYKGDMPAGSLVCRDLPSFFQQFKLLKVGWFSKQRVATKAFRAQNGCLGTARQWGGDLTRGHGNDGMSVMTRRIARVVIQSQQRIMLSSSLLSQHPSTWRPH